LDTFFHVAVTKKLISPNRSSNRIDIAYLYYLPFAKAFVSNDKLHKRVAPHLLREDQLFIDAEMFKQDLRALDAHYSDLLAELFEQGLVRFCKPPNDDRFLTTRIHRHFGSLIENVSLAPKQSEKVGAHIAAMVDAMKAEAGTPPVMSHGMMLEIGLTL
jgi:hypothetical protein